MKEPLSMQHKLVGIGLLLGVIARDFERDSMVDLEFTFRERFAVDGAARSVPFDKLSLELLR